jgi:hypothetical protein
MKNGRVSPGHFFIVIASEREATQLMEKEKVPFLHRT